MSEYICPIMLLGNCPVAYKFKYGNACLHSKRHGHNRTCDGKCVHLEQDVSCVEVEDE